MGKIVRLLIGPLLVLSACDGQASHFSSGSQETARASAARDGLAPGEWVTDAANILNDSEEDQIAQQLRELERKKGHQMVVVTVPTLEGQAIEDYTRSLANRWGVGRQEHNDGVVVLVAPNERQVRIAVGYGLEQVVTNNYAMTVIETEMIPRFKEGGYAAGVSAGVAKLIGRLSTR